MDYNATTQMGQALLIGELRLGQAAADTAATQKIMSEKTNADTLTRQKMSAENDNRALQEENKSLERDLAYSQRESIALNQALKERDALILEWIASNDGFKKLAKKYGEKLQISESQFKSDFVDSLIEVGEENQKLKETDYIKTAHEKKNTRAS